MILGLGMDCHGKSHMKLMFYKQESNSEFCLVLWVLFTFFPKGVLHLLSVTSIGIEKTTKSLKVFVS